MEEQIWSFRLSLGQKPEFLAGLCIPIKVTRPCFKRGHRVHLEQVFQVLGCKIISNYKLTSTFLQLFTISQVPQTSIGLIKAASPNTGPPKSFMTTGGIVCIVESRFRICPNFVWNNNNRKGILRSFVSSEGAVFPTIILWQVVFPLLMGTEYLKGLGLHYSTVNKQVLHSSLFWDMGQENNLSTSISSTSNMKDDSC